MQIANFAAARAGLAEHQDNAASFRVHAGEHACFQYLVAHPFDGERRVATARTFQKVRPLNGFCLSMSPICLKYSSYRILTSPMRRLPRDTDFFLPPSV